MLVSISNPTSKTRRITVFHRPFGRTKSKPALSCTARVPLSRRRRSPSTTPNRRGVDADLQRSRSVNSNWLPHGSVKYLLSIAPLGASAGTSIGPASTSTPCSTRYAVAASMSSTSKPM